MSNRVIEYELAVDEFNNYFESECFPIIGDIDNYEYKGKSGEDYLFAFENLFYHEVDMDIFNERGVVFINLQNVYEKALPKFLELFDNDNKNVFYVFVKEFVDRLYAKASALSLTSVKYVHLMSAFGTDEYNRLFGEKLGYCRENW